MEATYERKTDLMTFQKESRQVPMQGAEHVQLALKYAPECWMFCASSIRPTLKSSTEIEKLRDSLDPSYDCWTLIRNPSEFAKQLGISFGNSFKPEHVDHPGPIMWKLHPVVYVKHGPVIYTDQVSREIERFSQKMRGTVIPFIKRSKFSNQKEYRFVISLGSNAKPKNPFLPIPITNELKILTGTIE